MKQLPKFFLLFLLFISVKFSNGQKLSNTQNLTIDSLKTALLKSKPDIDQIELLNKLSDAYYKSKDSVNLNRTVFESIELCSNLIKRLSDEISIQKAKQFRLDAFNDKANFFYLIKNFDSAFYYYNYVFDKSDSLKYNIGFIEASKGIGRTLRWKSQYEKAITYLDKGIAASELLGDTYNKSELLNIKGVIYQNLDLHENSIVCYNESERLKKSIDDFEGIMQLKVNIAIAYARMGQIKEAGKIYREQAEYYRIKGDKLLFAEALGRVGANEGLQGHYNEAYQYHTKALEIFRTLNEKQGIGLEYNYIGIGKKETGDFDSALYYFENALAIYKSIGNPQKMAAVYYNIGNIELEKSELDKALEHYLLAKKIFEDVSSKKGIANCYSSIGAIYSKMKDYDKAEENMKLSVELDLKYKLKHELALDNQQLGTLYLLQKKYKEAIKCLLNADTLFIQMNDSSNLSSTRKSLADIEMEQKNSDKAIALLNQCISIDSASNSRSNEVYSRVAMAQVYMDLAENNSTLQQQHGTIALKHLHRALELAIQIKSSELQIIAYKELSNTEALLLHSEKSLNYYIQSVAIKDSLFNLEKIKQLNEIQTKYETEKKDNEILVLSNRNQIQSLTLKEQHTKLISKQLEFEKKENELSLLNQTKEIQQLQLEQSKKDVHHSELETKAKATLLELANKDKTLQQQEIENQKTIRNSLIVIAALLILVGIFLINRIQLQKKIEKQEAILAERRRISSDMHDDLGSGLSSIAMLSEVVKQHLTDKQDVSTLEKISHSAQQSLEKMSEIVWSLNPKNDTMDSLISYIRKYTAEYFEPTTIDCKIKLPQQIPDVTLSGEVRRNIFLVVKESLHNVIKHANATRVEMNIAANENQLSITIHDNGKGIDLSQPTNFGNGLINMQKRMKETGGSFSIENQNGTQVQLSMQLN